MRSTVGRRAIAALLVFTAAGAFAEAPVAVSPGSPAEVTATLGRCPTFSWGQAEGAVSYELVIYRLAGEDDEGPPLLRREFPGAVHGWTPPLDQCLEPGGRYAWTIRASSENGPGEWSAPNLFQIVSGWGGATVPEAVASGAAPVAETEASGGVLDPTAPAAAWVPTAVRTEGSTESRAPATGEQSLVAYGDPCCDGNDPDSYATELGNDSTENDPDVLALLTKKHGSGPNVNFIGFFDREELTDTPRLIGEIESTAGGGVHFTGSASISGWERVSSNAFLCTAGNLNCPGAVDCSPGKKVLGGGFNSTANQPIHVWASHASGDATWSVGLGNAGGVTVSFTVEAICAEVGP